MTTVTDVNTSRKGAAYPPGGPSPAMPTETPKIVQFGSVMEALRADAEAATEALTKGVKRGPGTPLRSLDDVLGGARQPGVHIVLGGSGTGKTAWALQEAAECGFPALFVSCEMHLVELLKRHTARVTGTFLGTLKDGTRPPDDVVKLAERAIAAAPALFLVDATRAYLSPTLLWRFATVAKGEAKHVLVVVDSVHSWSEASPESLSEYDSLNVHLAELRRLASTLNCPVLGVGERNRLSMKDGGLNSGAGTRKLEYGAESVTNICPEEGKDVPVLPPGQMAVRITVDKNRNGAAGMSLKAIFHGGLQKFTDREPGT